jgi:nicotinate-nucleotide pyrophosphorylase (carboxylating)
VKPDAERIAAVALAEDGETDVTSGLTVPAGLDGQGRIEYRSGGVVAGAAFADAVARGCECRIEWRVPDGRVVPAGSVIGAVLGPLRRILRAERPMLNLLQRACGIATATRSYVQAVAGTSCRILHTRKTAPGLRALDVAAVLSGGGARHRLDLSHEVMVKDNHWQGLRLSHSSLAVALADARAKGITSLQVEVESMDQLEGPVPRGPHGCWWTTSHRRRFANGCHARESSRGTSRSKPPVGSRSAMSGRTRRQGRTTSRSAR